MVDPEKLRICPDCGSRNVRYDGSEDALVCSDCGLIFEELTKEEQERYDRLHNLKKKQ